jgi:hypothetical protein
MGFPVMRNNFVLVRVLQKQAQKIGNIEIAGALDREIEQVEILSVGLGVISAAGGRADTYDLNPGDLALAQMKTFRKGPGGVDQFQEKQVKLVFEGEALAIIEQYQIIAVIPQENTRIN